MTRHAPVQQRSRNTKHRLTIIAQGLIRYSPDVGPERFTTADMARLAKVSIGTVYRYWRDRVDVLDELYPERVTVLEPNFEAAEVVARQWLTEAAKTGLMPDVAEEMTRTLITAWQSPRSLNEGAPHADQS